jgi:hypothetical protein
MLVAIMPPPALQKTLTRIRGIEIRQPMSVADAHRSLRLAETRLVILDPAGLREDIFEAFLDCIVASGASLVLYGSLGSVFCARSVRAAKTMSIEIILSGGEDEFAVLTRMIRAIGSPTATSLLMSAFADRLTPGGDILAVGIISLFTDRQAAVQLHNLRSDSQWTRRQYGQGCGRADSGHPSALSTAFELRARIQSCRAHKRYRLPRPLLVLVGRLEQCAVSSNNY